MPTPAPAESLDGFVEAAAVALEIIVGMEVGTTEPAIVVVTSTTLAYGMLVEKTVFLSYASSQQSAISLLLPQQYSPVSGQ